MERRAELRGAVYEVIAKLAMVWPAYTDDDLDGTYDGVLASAARDAQALANPVALAGEDA